MIWAHFHPLSQQSVWKQLKTNTLFEWQVDALWRQRGRGWQAAATVVLLPHKLLLLVKLQESPSWSLLPVPYSLPPSVHSSIHPGFFPDSLFFIFYPTFPFPLISSLFTLHLQSFPNFLSSFIWATFLFRRYKKASTKYTCLTSFSGWSQQHLWFCTKLHSFEWNYCHFPVKFNWIWTACKLWLARGVAVLQNIEIYPFIFFHFLWYIQAE